jgi:hypothetical protein
MNPRPLRALIILGVLLTLATFATIANAAFYATIHIKLKNYSKDEQRPFEIRRGTVFAVRSSDGKFCQNFAVVEHKAGLLDPGKEGDFHLRVVCISGESTSSCVTENKPPIVEITPMMVKLDNM